MRFGKSCTAVLGILLVASCGHVKRQAPPAPVASTPAPTPSQSAPQAVKATKKPTPPSSYHPQFCGVTSQVDSGKASRVLLTIDDFPYNDPTSMLQVADWARKSNTMMEAFPIAREVNAYDRRHDTDLVGQLRARGTYVSNHTYSHADLTKVSSAEVQRQVKRGVKSSYVRPPYGAYSQMVRRLIEGRGLRVCHWTIDTRDWQKINGKYPPADLLVRRVRAQLKKVKRGTPVVILGHYQTNYPKALPAIRALAVQYKMTICAPPTAPTTAQVPYPIC